MDLFSSVCVWLGRSVLLSLGKDRGAYCVLPAEADRRLLSSFFAHSKETTLFGGQLWVVVMVGISLFSCYLSQRFSFDPKL